MKTIFSILFFCCLSQIVDAKMVTIRGEIQNYDKAEMADIVILLMDKKNENNSIQIKVDSLGQFEIVLSKQNYYQLKVYSKKYHNITKTLRYLSGKEKSIIIELIKRQEPLNVVAIPTFNYTQNISKPDSSIVSIKGKVFDEAGEPLMFASVAIYKNGALVTGVQTDFDGEFYFNSLEYRLYDIEVSYVGYNSVRIVNVMAVNDKITFVNIVMKSGVESICICNPYSVPLIEQDNTTQGAVFTAKEIGRSPHKN
ncbi:MAG: carboxypeptidase-like regulatory domain-containing protein [Saprospiraceae bacterium]